ncbi:MAG: DUF58 domain-containing protein [Chromatiales bacterium]
MNPVAVTLAQLVQLAPQAERLALWSTTPRAAQVGSNYAVFKGRGMEFAESRPYEPGDDVRLIDWRVTARTGRAHTKLFREERERPVVIWVDCRAHMFFATRGVFKTVMAAHLAALAAWAARAHGDRLGGRVCGEGEEFLLEPDRGRRGVLRFLRALERGCSSPPAAEPADAAAVRLRRSLMSLRRSVRPGTVVFLISDFDDMHDPLRELLADLSRHCELTLCFVYDPLEADLPPPGDYPIAGTRGRQAVLFAGDGLLRSRYRQRFHARQRALQDMAWAHRARFISVATTSDPLRQLRSACNQGSTTATRRAV